MSSSDKNNSLFNPKSNAFKNILKNPKEEKKSFGKEEFLARRKFFLQKLENDGGIPKPKTSITNSSTKRKTSNEKIKTAVTVTKSINNENIKPAAKNINRIASPIPISSNSSRSNIDNIEKLSLPSSHEWTIASAKSESLKKIIDLAEKKDTNTVGKNVFNARQKFFADSQLNSVDQLMPRPCTPPGYCYFEKCPSPSLEPRRNSYGLYSSSPILSPSLKPASPIPSLSILSSSPTPSNSTYSLPWEHGNNKKKEVDQSKPQSNHGIESLEKVPLKSEISLPDPVNFKKESINIEKPSEVLIEKVEAAKSFMPKIITILPEPIQASTIALPHDESISVEIIKAKTIEPQLPKYITISEKLPEPVKFEKIQLPDDEPIELTTETIEISKLYTPKPIYILPEPVKFTKELLPEDEALEVQSEIVVAEKQQFSKIISILPEPVEINVESLPQDEPLNTMTINVVPENQQIAKVIENVEQPEEIIKDDGVLNNYYSSESKPLIDIDNEITSDNSSTENINENQPLLSFSNENIESSKQTKSLLDIDNDLFINDYQNKPLIDFNNETTEINNNIETEAPLINFDENPILVDVKEESYKKTNSIGSISELLINGTLSLDEPLPRKSIPPTPNSEINDNLIELSDSEMSDKVKNWYNVVETAINKEEKLEDSLI